MNAVHFSGIIFFAKTSALADGTPVVNFRVREHSGGHPSEINVAAYADLAVDFDAEIIVGRRVVISGRLRQQRSGAVFLQADSLAFGPVSSDDRP
jgi:hypothetical protein